MRKDNVRVFFPVGMGGFSFERMDESTVVYDCGSTSAKVIKENVKALKADFFGAKDRVIDHLFISHFDSDHRNGVETLLSLFDVKEIHLPYVDYKYRAVLNMMTHNGVVNLFNTFIQYGVGSRLAFYQTNRTTAHSIRSKNGHRSEEQHDVQQELREIPESDRKMDSDSGGAQSGGIYR